MLNSNLDKFFVVYKGGEGVRGRKERDNIFSAISSCKIFKGRFFGVLNKNLDKLFGSYPTGPIHMGRGGGVKGIFLANIILWIV